MKNRSLRWACALAAGGILLCSPCRAWSDDHAAPSIVQDYGHVLTVYATYAPHIWHETPDGGYWGDGIDAKDQNGAVRGSANTLMTYAVLARALDAGWLAPADVETLNRCGLDRKALLEYVRKDLSFLVGHHKAVGTSPGPQWGYGWQTSLWTQALGIGALSVWKDLSPELQSGMRTVAAAEADRLSSLSPKTMQPGDTGAEENGWNTGALAVALAIAPDATSATTWMGSVESFAANTYSLPSEKNGKAGSAGDPVLSRITTANVQPDYTLINHGFFHPDYVQVSGQHLGEALMILRLGDELNGTSLAREFLPFASHNVLPVWNHVMLPLTLPSGEVFYPAGNDWTYHCGTTQGYLAYLVTQFQNPDAAEAERRGLEILSRRESASPSGRLLGDSNLAWWWEPLVCKRCCTALLQHIQNPHQPGGTSTLDSLTTSVQWPSGKAWMFRNPDYLVSVSWGEKDNITFVALKGMSEKLPFLSLPQKGQLCRAGVSGIRSHDIPNGEALMILPEHGRHDRQWLVCLPHSAVLISENQSGPFYIENDSLSAPGRKIRTADGLHQVPALKPSHDLNIPGPFLVVDDTLSIVGPRSFHYEPAGKWNRPSVAVDKLTWQAPDHICQFFPGTSGEARVAAHVLSADPRSTGTMNFLVRDGADSARYAIHIDTKTGSVSVAGQSEVSRPASPAVGVVKTLLEKTKGEE